MIELIKKTQTQQQQKKNKQAKPSQNAREIELEVLNEWCSMKHPALGCLYLIY